jgi:acyl-CoA synthetase (AMP-forming)/AMP-acid ligase II
MLVSANCRAFVAILLALAHIDACPVVVDANLSTQEVDQLQAECHPRRVFYMISASPHAEAHALRHHATRLDPVDWGPIAISALNDSAKPVI